MIKKKIISALALMLALLSVVSCGPTTPVEIPGDTETTAPGEGSTAVVFDPSIPEGILVAGPEITSSCAIVYPSGSKAIKTAAENFAEYFMTLIPGSTFTAYTANETISEEYSIVLKNDSTLEDFYSIKLDGKTVTVTGKEAKYTLEGLSYLKLTAFQNGYFAIPEDLDQKINKAPTVFEYSPENLYYYEDVYTPVLFYDFAETHVNKENSRLVIDGVDVIDKATWGFGELLLNSVTVEPGDHTAILCLAGTNGGCKVIETIFSCGDASEMNLYSGELHAHTGDSDGKETVKEAYKYARDVAKLDFFSVTDHSNSFSNSVYQSKHQTNADNYNDPGTFVALFGYEQTYNAATYYGHLNTNNYPSLTTRSTLLKNYYAIMAKRDDSIVMFNHPGYKWGNFCEYEFWSESFDKVVNLAEIKGKGYDIEYALCLTKGWHVSPLYNEDNHSANWGAAYEYCGYALAPSLTRQNIVEAFQKNRTYTTTDKSLKIYYKINDEWMGSRLNNPDKLKVSVDLSTDKAIGLGVVSLMAEDNIVVAQQNVGRDKKFTWEFEIDPKYDYYYVKVHADTTWCVTAPIWIENREELTVTSIEQALVTNTVDNKEQRIIATVKNSASTDMTNVKVDFYLSSTAGFNLTTVKPSATVEVGTIRAGESVEVFADLPYSSATPRIYAIASGEAGGKQFGAVRYCEISNLYFTEIVPLCAKGGVAAYEFIELYNNTNHTVNLSNYTIRYYAKPGANADSLAENTWKLTGTIAPHSTLVLWFVTTNNKLSVADFNNRYGTSLVGGKDIVMIVGNPLPDTNPVQLELMTGGKVLTRCWFNWEGAKDVATDKSILFNYPTNYTATAVVSKTQVTPTPGTLEEGQMPEPVQK